MAIILMVDVELVTAMQQHGPSACLCKQQAANLQGKTALPIYVKYGIKTVRTSKCVPTPS